jgi:hypothetical protein
MPGSEHQSTPESSVVLSSAVDRRPRKHAWSNPATIIACSSLAFAACGIAARVTQLLDLESALLRTGASYTRESTGPLRFHARGEVSASESWLQRVTKLIRCDFDSIVLRSNSLRDGDLTFLAEMKSLETLELRSQIATNRTLGLISRLPNLRHLTLSGEQFTINGYLALRHASSLRSLKIREDVLSPLELAVLKEELPGIQIQSDAIPKTRFIGSAQCPRQ